MTVKVKKKDEAKELIHRNKNLFKCPVCNDSMYMNEYKLTCNSKHNFDLSKKGYLNLLTTASNTGFYSKELFESRHQICEAGFYDPLINELTKLITEHKKIISNNIINIMDAGCGEGSHIYGIYTKMNDNKDTNFVGVDISKDSINIASRNNAGIIWCVADLAKLPFQESQFDFILNILSPANYSEFDRVLNENGIVIKVVPGKDYLKELRESIYDDKDNEYSNSKVIDYFNDKLEVINIKNINYRFEMDDKLLAHLIKMTPLTWGRNTESLDLDFIKNTYITVDLTVIIGKKK